MFKTLSQDVMKIFNRPKNLPNGVWNHYTNSQLISNNIKFNIYYKECIDSNRKEPIDRYYSQLDFTFGKKIYREEAFIFLNGYNGPNCKENYYEHKLFENNNLINYNQINPLVFKKINLFIMANELDEILKKYKAIGYHRKFYPNEKEIIYNNYLRFCDELEKNVITRHIGNPSKEFVRINKYDVPSIIKEYNLIQPIIKKWSKITGQDLLTDRLYNIYLDFLLVG